MTTNSSIITASKRQSNPDTISHTTWPNLLIWIDILQLHERLRDTPNDLYLRGHLRGRIASVRGEVAYRVAAADSARAGCVETGSEAVFWTASIEAVGACVGLVVRDVEYEWPRCAWGDQVGKRECEGESEVMHVESGEVRSR